MKRIKCIMKTSYQLDFVSLWSAIKANVADVKPRPNIWNGCGSNIKEEASTKWYRCLGDVQVRWQLLFPTDARSGETNWLVVHGVVCGKRSVLRRDYVIDMGNHLPARSSGPDCQVEHSILYLRAGGVWWCFWAAQRQRLAIRNGGNQLENGIHMIQTPAISRVIETRSNQACPSAPPTVWLVHSPLLRADQRDAADRDWSRGFLIDGPLAACVPFWPLGSRSTRGTHNKAVHHATQPLPVGWDLINRK